MSRVLGLVHPEALVEMLSGTKKHYTLKAYTVFCINILQNINKVHTVRVENKHEAQLTKHVSGLVISKCTHFRRTKLHGVS
jgi:hypothetical protein